MSDQRGIGRFFTYAYDINKPQKKKYMLNIILFIITFLSCAFAGYIWTADVSNGLLYAVLILTFLSAHEFGHYFASKYHNVDATLPYYIPMPILFGTMGAIIRTKTPVPSRKALFDIGVSGPIAGFIVCVIFLIIGLNDPAGIEYIYGLHPHYVSDLGGIIPKTGIHFGDSILFAFLSNAIVEPGSFIPPMNEIYHYPFLCVGWFGIFVTAMNMIPVGQLDGGHVTYAMFGLAHSKIARVFWWGLITLGAGSAFGYLYEYFQDPNLNSVENLLKSAFMPFLSLLREYIPWYFNGWFGWIFWAFVLKIFVRLDHPPIADISEIDPGRKLIGWIALLILALCFTYNGIYEL